MFKQKGFIPIIALLVGGIITLTSLGIYLDKKQVSANPDIIVGATSADLWKLQSGNVQALKDTWGLSVPGIKQATTRCLQIDNTGAFSAYSAGCA
jgi:hypothetical protein